MESTESSHREITPSDSPALTPKGQRALYFSLACLALWVLVIALGIEWYNARAGYYLPRMDMMEDSPSVNKWRTSFFLDPRDELHSRVAGVGILQYPLAALLIACSLIGLASSRNKPIRIFLFLACTATIGIFALSLAYYRGYYTSLGGF